MVRCPARTVVRGTRGHVADATDCDDGSAAVIGATEVCNSVDDDCDGDVDDDDSVLCRNGRTFLPRFGLGYLRVGLSPKMACSMLCGYVANADDCDDSKVGVNPGPRKRAIRMMTIGWGHDEDGATELAQYADWDGDSYGDAGVKRLHARHLPDT